MTIAGLMISVAVLAAIIIAALVLWRYRRLKLRAGRSAIEYFPPATPPDETSR